MPPAEPPLLPLDFSRTQRIVFLIDLHPLLTSRNPTHYLSTVTSAASRLLRFPQLSASLFSYKFFFSSLSPERSATVLPCQLSGSSLSFNLPLETLDSLSAALNSISIDADLIYSSWCPSARHIAYSLVRLINDYAWETDDFDRSPGKDDLIFADFAKDIRSHLVILFSPVLSSIECLTASQFDAVFRLAKETFKSKGIHLCWIDFVESDDEMKIVGVDEMKSDWGLKLAILKDAIKKMGWGFCSTNLIVLGSALLPLGLIYPKIGISVDLVDFHRSDKKKCYGALSLEVLDVNGMQLECRCCDLEFVSLKSLPSCIKSDGILSASGLVDAERQDNSQDTFLGRFGNEIVKLHVVKLHKYDGCGKFGAPSDIVLVRERFQSSGKEIKKSGGDFFADRVLGMLHEEMRGVANRSQLPIWQIFLSFLYLKGCCALVSISDSKGATFVGSLKPFSSHLATLSVFNAGHFSVKAKSCLKLPKMDIQSQDTCAEEMNDCNSFHGSQNETFTSSNCASNRAGKKKKVQRYLYRDMTWSSFCKAAFAGLNFDLFEVYSSRQFEKCKKLKFLKCWIKQIMKVDTYELTTLHRTKSLEESTTCKGLLSEPSQVEEGAILFSNAETSETFFNNLSKTIQHGLESGMDSRNLAERVVKSSSQWLHQKFETEYSFESQQPIGNSNDSCRGTVDTLIKHLLREPMEVKKIHQDDTSLEKAHDYSSSENIVREYEMQIFLRMEILLLDVSAMIEKSRKQKLVKQICSLLEFMQYHLAGGIDSHITLYDYVEQTIKARYSDRLEDVVKTIYSRLDLLLFAEEGETTTLLFNSEDSNHSWIDIHERSKKAEANNINRSLSTEGDSSQPLANTVEWPEETGEKHVRMLSEAKEIRERNRRRVSYTSRAPDLQRVWAPKQPKSTIGKFDSLPKKSKTKDRRGSSYTVVSETPMTGNKRNLSRENKKGDKEQHDLGKSSYSVSKALFQDT